MNAAYLCKLSDIKNCFTKVLFHPTKSSYHLSKVSYQAFPLRTKQAFAVKKKACSGGTSLFPEAENFRIATDT